MKRFAKALSMLLAILMVVGLTPLSIIAEDMQKTHVVAFNLNYNGAHRIPSQRVADGERAVQPENVTREGWIFEYWYIRTDDGIQKFDLSEPITKDMTLYAQWDEDPAYWGAIWDRNITGMIASSSKTYNKTYTVTFDANGSDVKNLPNAQYVEEGRCANEPNEPSRDGYTFIYWRDQFGEYFDFSAPVESDITLYAYFVPNVYTENDIQDMLSGYEGELNETLDAIFSPITGVDVYYHMNDVGTVYLRDNVLYRLEGISGLVGSPIDIGYTGTGITKANVTLYFSDVSRTSIDLSDLTVFRYDEVNDTITLLADDLLNVGNDSISFSTTELGVFGVFQKSVWNEAQSKLLPAIRTDETPYYNVIMAIDTSASMSGTKIATSIQVATEFIDVLANDDYFSLLSFDTYPTVLCSRTKLVESDETNNRNTIKNLIQGLCANGGTDIDLTLQASINECIDHSQYKNLIVLVSDGQSKVSNETLEAVKEKNAVVVAVGIGADVDNTLMQRIAKGTGGSYIYCKDASDLQDAFLALQVGYIGSNIDTDNDGLPDLVEITGMRDQYGEIWRTDPNLADTDNDGFMDGEEMGEYHDGIHPYFSRVSRPDMVTKKKKLAVVLTLNGDTPPYMRIVIRILNGRILTKQIGSLLL